MAGRQNRGSRPLRKRDPGLQLHRLRRTPEVAQEKVDFKPEQIRSGGSKAHFFTDFFGRPTPGKLLFLLTVTGAIAIVAAFIVESFIDPNKMTKPKKRGNQPVFDTPFVRDR